MARTPLNKSKVTDVEKKRLIHEIVKAHYDRYKEYRRYPSDRLRRPKKRTINEYGDELDHDYDFVEETNEIRKKDTKKTPVNKPKKVEKTTRSRNLEDLKKIKELKDQIEALKTRMVRKDATIKNLKRKVEKLKDEIENPKKEEERQLRILVENPDFLEIV